MGGLVEDAYVAGMLGALNLRFAPGDGIKEMAALQKEFDIFSGKHSFRDVLRLLNIGPAENWSQRRGWYKYLESLDKMDSDKAGQKAGAKIVAALRKHLTSTAPAPVYFTAHSSGKNPNVVIKERDKPLVYSTVEYLTISLPMTAVEKDRARRRAGA